MKYATIIFLLVQIPFISVSQGKFFGGSGSGYDSDTFTVNGEETPTLSVTSVNELMVYPNPVKTTAFYNGGLNELLQVYSINGKLVKNYPSFNGRIEMTGMKPGIYTIKSGNQIFKLVKKE